MKCIICKEEKDTVTSEHIFPEAIGGCFVINCVCKECNDMMGNRIDCHLVNHWVIQGKRLTLKIHGKTGKIPNPLENGTLSSNNNQKIKYLINEKGDPENVYLVPNIQKNETENGLLDVSINLDISDKDKLPEIINKILRRKGLKELTEKEIFSNTTENTISQPKINQSFLFDSEKYKKSIYKIAYEFSFYWLGELFLSDKTGEQIRQYILYDGFDNKDKYILNGDICFVEEKSKFPYCEDTPESHIAILARCGNKYVISIRIFSLIEAVVVVSNTASIYENKTMFLINDPLSKTIRENTLNEELIRIGNKYVRE